VSRSQKIFAWGNLSECSTTAFTLIELLVVVAIIAILAALAIPNFIEASVRAKVARVKNDTRVLQLALEAYSIDFQSYPPATGVGMYKGFGGGRLAAPVSVRLYPLTTPLSYVSSVFKDAFTIHRSIGGGETSDIYDTFDYVDARSLPEYGCGLTSGGEWRLVSPGPDGIMAYGGCALTQYTHPEANIYGVDYDPTNGTVSIGDLVRVGPYSTVGGDPLDPNNPNRPGIVRVPTYVEQFL
jgi:prepilin-type N-terminal cleavage/methylation domain-containing protein